MRNSVRKKQTTLILIVSILKIRVTWGLTHGNQHLMYAFLKNFRKMFVCIFSALDHLQAWKVVITLFGYLVRYHFQLRLLQITFVSQFAESPISITNIFEIESPFKNG